METIAPKLHVSSPEPLGFGPDLEIRAYLLERYQGNLLIYRSAALEHDTQQIRALGGVFRQYLNHSHEASPATDWVASTFGAPLYVHEDDAPETSEVSTFHETFTTRHRLDDDFEVIPVPGHTPGATVYLWDSGRHRTLFTGDTIFFSGGKWRAAILDGIGNRDQHIASLEMIRNLDFDLVIPGIAPAGDPFYAAVDKAEAEQRIDAIINRLRSGENG